MTQFASLKNKMLRMYPDMPLLEQENMSRHTTFRVGGPAALMALPQNTQQAVFAVRAAAEEGVRPVFLGNGSNLLCLLYTSPSPRD